MHVRLSTVLLVLGAVLAGAVAAAVFVLYAGFYNVAATHQHLRPTYWLLQIGLREAIERRGRDIAVPNLADPALVERGLALYAGHCAQCHGAPGLAPEPFALGLTPLPKNLAYVARVRTAGELYWVTRHGIKMTGMPAWQFRFSERDLWSVVAFVRQLPSMTPDDYLVRSRTAGAHVHTAADEPERAAGDPARGRTAIEQYACTTCHAIPGVTDPSAPVGPPLDRIATRKYIAGVLPNTPENMLRWLRFPQAVSPGSAMPDLGLSRRDALDIAAYLYTLR